jgi:hypothetical protein
MLGKVYTFERDFTGDFPPYAETVAAAAVNAIVAASNALGGIRHEELTEADNPRPIVALLFPDAARMQKFDALIAAALAPRAIRVTVAHTGDAARADKAARAPQHVHAA